MKITKKC